MSARALYLYQHFHASNSSAFGHGCMLNKAGIFFEGTVDTGTDIDQLRMDVV